MMNRQQTISFFSPRQEDISLWVKVLAAVTLVVWVLMMISALSAIVVLFSSQVPQ
jgi:hypothetical protein